MGNNYRVYFVVMDECAERLQKYAHCLCNVLMVGNAVLPCDAASVLRNSVAFTS